jgi:uncharacterized protein
VTLEFSWDEQKAKSNIKKHQVTFEEATTVFNDPLARIFEDELHSFDEIREIIIGQSDQNHLLLVYFTEKTSGLIRIFSARKATKKERKDYEEYINQ